MSLRSRSRSAVFTTTWSSGSAWAAPDASGAPTSRPNGLRKRSCACIEGSRRAEQCVASRSPSGGLGGGVDDAREGTREGRQCRRTGSANGLVPATVADVGPNSDRARCPSLARRSRQKDARRARRGDELVQSGMPRGDVRPRRSAARPRDRASGAAATRPPRPQPAPPLRRARLQRPARRAQLPPRRPRGSFRSRSPRPPRRSPAPRRSRGRTARPRSPSGVLGTSTMCAVR